jgi:hypothetical protein
MSEVIAVCPVIEAKVDALGDKLDRSEERNDAAHSLIRDELSAHNSRMWAASRFVVLLVVAALGALAALHIRVDG